LKIFSRAERGQIQRDWMAASAESGRQVDGRDLGGRTGSHPDYVGLSAAVQEELLQPVFGLAGGQERVILALHVRHAEHMADLVHWPALEESQERAIEVETPAIVWTRWRSRCRNRDRWERPPCQLPRSRARHSRPHLIETLGRACRRDVTAASRPQAGHHQGLGIVA
jgi:hypothetical protein